MIGMTQDIVPDGRVLNVSAAGEFSLDEAKRTFLEIIDSIRANGSEKVFFDGRDIIGNPLVIERFYYGEFVADVVENLRRSPEYDGVPQFAYVLSEPVLDPQRLGETVAVNRGVNVKVFDNVPDALQWLRAS
jgi:hypothetical protein